MDRIRAGLHKVQEYAKALVGGAAVAVTPVVLDALADLSTNEDRAVAVFATLVLVWLVPNRKPAVAD
jgi:hypothetical protein